MGYVLQSSQHVNQLCLQQILDSFGYLLEFIIQIAKSIFGIRYLCVMKSTLGNSLIYLQFLLQAVLHCTY